MQLDIHVHLDGPIEINFAPSEQVPAWGMEILERLEDLSILLGRLQQEVRHMDHNIDELTAEVADESTQIDSLSVLTANIKKALDDALSGASLPPAVQAKVNAIFSSIQNNKQKVVDSINANTPAAEPAPS
jgi:hypothetical protein